MRGTPYHIAGMMPNLPRRPVLIDAGFAHFGQVNDHPFCVGMHWDTLVGDVIPANHTHLRVVDFNSESRRMIRCSILRECPRTSYQTAK